MFIILVSVALGVILGVIVNSIIVDNCGTLRARKFWYSYGYYLCTLIFCVVIGFTSHLLVWRSMSSMMREITVSDQQTLYGFVMNQTNEQPITSLLGIASDLPVIGSTAEELQSLLNQSGITEQELFSSIEQVKAEYSLEDSWMIMNSFTEWMDGALELAEATKILEYLP